MTAVAASVTEMETANTAVDPSKLGVYYIPRNLMVPSLPSGGRMTRRTFCVIVSSIAAFCAGAYAAQQLERINPDGLSTPQTYAHVVKAGKTLYIAGQVGAGPDGVVAGPGMAEQLDRVLTNLGLALKSQGADFSHIAKITIFTTSIAEFREAAAVRAKHFGTHRPASTLVQISQLANPAFKVEIEAIAVLP
jgi:enamine deaminase RidA (YjgF/YER057c/UK114 family)